MTIFFNKKMHLFLAIIGVIYLIYTLSVQQKKLDSYAIDRAYYETQIEDLKAKKEDLLQVKENVDSPEYIEEMAREKLDMYLPNERVYVDMSK